MRLNNSVLSLMVLSLVATSGLAQDSSANGSNGAPRIVMKSPNHDFGEITAGTPLRHTFVFRNEGKADLVIQSVTPG